MPCRWYPLDVFDGTCQAKRRTAEKSKPKHESQALQTAIQNTPSTPFAKSLEHLRPLLPPKSSPSTLLPFHRRNPVPTEFHPTLPSRAQFLPRYIRDANIRYEKARIRHSL